jgi:hypothetical protein
VERPKELIRCSQDCFSEKKRFSLIVPSETAKEKTMDANYIIVPHGRWLPCFYVWRDNLLVYVAKTYQEAETYITHQGGTLPPKPGWMKEF